MDTVVAWRIYYDDGSVFTSDDGPPWASPQWGAQAIAQLSDDAEHGRCLAAGKYVWVHRTDTGVWHEYDEVGYIDVMLNHARFVDCVRFGRMIATRRFSAIWKQAREWAHG